MKLGRFKLGLILISVLAVGVVGIRLLQQHPPGHGAEKGKGVYYCPMHPTYTSDRPGDCPICNMKLVKRDSAPDEKPAAPDAKPAAPDAAHRHEGMEHPQEGTAGFEAGNAGLAAGTAGYAPVHLSDEKQRMIGVKTAAVQRRRLLKTIRTVGRIAYDPELYQAQAEYLQALAAGRETGAAGLAGQAGELIEAARMRLRLLGLSDSFIDEMAGWDGPDRSLLLAGPDGRVWLYAPIYEFELPHVKVGQEVRVEVQAIPGKGLKGTVQSVDPVLDPTTRTVRIRAILVDPERILRPEMYVNVLLEIPLGELLAVPAAALFDTGTRRIAFVEKGEGLLEPREVTAGARADDFLEVKSGLKEGDRVLVSGNFLIDSESRLKAALEGEAHQHAH